MRFQFAALAAVGMVAVSRPDLAQTGPSVVSVAGTVYDSLRSAPLAGAFVTIAGTGLQATTDPLGHFRFDSVTPGSYLFRAQHDVLDSAGFSGFTARVTVTDGRAEVRIATPSFATLWRTACGTGGVPKDSGFVYGTVRDASTRTPVPNVTVDLSWYETRVDTGWLIKQVYWRRETKSDSSGGYSMCGVPRGQWARIGAGTATSVSGLIDLLPTDVPVLRRDLVIGPPNATDTTRRGTITGILNDLAGAPFADARILVDDNPEVRSDATGRFVVHDVPAGTRQLEILSIGMLPVLMAVDVVPYDTTSIVATLKKVTTLDVVRVMSSRRGRRLAEELEVRRGMGFGHMMDASKIAGRTELFTLFHEFPSARITSRNGNFTVSVPDGRGGLCQPDVWLDGSQSAQEVLNQIQPNELAAVEVYPHPGTVPMRFTSTGLKPRCGVILLWTKFAFR
jgi:hypothetical protein